MVDEHRVPQERHISEREMMRLHGTKAFELPPSAVASTAQADIDRRIANQTPMFDVTGKRLRNRQYERYAFHRKHVRWAAENNPTPEGLIERALGDIVAGQSSSKFNTRLIYDEALLMKALWHIAEMKIEKAMATDGWLSQPADF